jgi:hypothetical protein
MQINRTFLTLLLIQIEKSQRSSQYLKSSILIWQRRESLLGMMKAIANLTSKAIYFCSAVTFRLMNEINTNLLNNLIVSSGEPSQLTTPFRSPQGKITPCHSQKQLLGLEKVNVKNTSKILKVSKVADLPKVM